MLDRKEIYECFRECIKIANQYYKKEQVSFKNLTDKFNKILNKFNFKIYTNIQVLQKQDYKGFAFHKQFKSNNYATFHKKGNWNNVYIWFGIYDNGNKFTLYIVKSNECNDFKALRKMQFDGVFDRNSDKFQIIGDCDNYENLKEQIYDKFVFLINYMNNFQEDDYLIINKNENKIEVNMDYPLNQILYGAPGVGKTYNTINIALEILGEDFSNYSDKTLKRKAMQEKFKEYLEKEQIVFTTFHQSYGYEEFVEGIRPISDNGEIKYVVANGIFKSLCEQAKGNTELINNFDTLIEKLKEKSSIDLADPEKYFNIPNTKYHIQFRDGRTFRIKFDGMSDKYKDYPVNIESIREMYKNPKLEIYNSAYAKVIIEYLKILGLKEYTENSIKKPYIIIIDEINRGNISKIFGELITLIEPSKRLGNTEELEVVLPYSKERFSVPNNVYIIGTMNTADRSITTLDTALRRRFEFKKIMPTSSLLSSDCDGVNLQELLNKMNERIECLIGDEKLIGHSYFMDINSIDELKAVFRNKILPLLEEYFYNDYSQIKSVLNDNKELIVSKNMLNQEVLRINNKFFENGLTKDWFKQIYEG